MTKVRIISSSDGSRDWEEYVSCEERIVRFLVARDFNVSKAVVMW